MAIWTVGPALAVAAVLALAPVAAGNGAGDNAAALARFAAPLTDVPGDAARGRDLVLARERGNCIVCHAIPAPDAAYHGNLGPPLAGIAAKRTAAELRARLVDSRLINPRTLMPPYHATEGLVRVGKPYVGRPVLTAQEIEDVLAFLMTLRD